MKVLNEEKKSKNPHPEPEELHFLPVGTKFDIFYFQIFY